MAEKWHNIKILGSCIMCPFPGVDTRCAGVGLRSEARRPRRDAPRVEHDRGDRGAQEKVAVGDEASSLGGVRSKGKLGCRVHFVLCVWGRIEVFQDMESKMLAH